MITASECRTSVNHANRRQCERANAECETELVNRVYATLREAERCSRYLSVLDANVDFRHDLRVIDTTAILLLDEAETTSMQSDAIVDVAINSCEFVGRLQSLPMSRLLAIDSDVPRDNDHPETHAIKPTGLTW